MRTGRVIAELDCTAGLEIAMPSRNSDRVVVLNIESSGALTPAFTIPMAAGSGPQNLAVADLEGDGDQDIFVAHSDPGFSVLTNSCNGNFIAKAHPAQWVSGNNAYEGGPTLDKRIAVGRDYCPGQPNGLAVAIGWGTRVGVKCVDENGDFPMHEEPHGQADPTQGFLDYGFELVPSDFSEGGADPTVAGLALEGGQLFALRNGEASNFGRLWWLVPSKCAFTNSFVRMRIADLGSGGTIRDMATYRLTPNDAEWTGFAVVGAPGLGLVH